MRESDPDATRALEAVFRAESTKLWRSLVLFGGDLDVASEAVAEAFAQALARGDGIRDPAAWVWRAAFKIATGELAARRPEVGGAMSDGVVLESPEELIDLQRALDELTPHQRAAVVLADYAGYPHAAVAGYLDPRWAPSRSTSIVDGAGYGWPSRSTMRDLRERLSVVDELEPPDLWRDATSRTPTPRSLNEGPPPGRRLVAGLAAVAIFLSTSIWLWVEIRTPTEPADPVPSPSVDGLASLQEGWTELVAPHDPRGGGVWAGTELLVWGGSTGDDEVLDDGYRFDPLTGSTAPMADGPLEARGQAAMAWTGDELLVWGGWGGSNTILR